MNDKNLQKNAPDFNPGKNCISFSFDAKINIKTSGKDKVELIIMPYGDREELLKYLTDGSVIKTTVFASETYSGYPEEYMNPTPKKERLWINDKLYLTSREIDVMKKMALYMSNKLIESDLGLKTSSVANYVHNIFIKLNARNRVEAVNIFNSLYLDYLRKRRA